MQHYLIVHVWCFTTCSSKLQKRRERIGLTYLLLLAVLSLLREFVSRYHLNNDYVIDWSARSPPPTIIITVLSSSILDTFHRQLRLQNIKTHNPFIIALRTVSECRGYFSQRDGSYGRRRQRRRGLLIATTTLLSIFLSFGPGRYFNIFILHMILCNNEQEDDIIFIPQDKMPWGCNPTFFAVSTGTQEDTILKRAHASLGQSDKNSKFSLLTFV